MTIRDYFGNPPEWGEHGRKMTAWLNEWAERYRSLSWESGDLSMSWNESSTGRFRQVFADTGGTVILERLLNGIRVTLESENNKLEYMTDGGTEIGRWNRVDGYFELARTETATPNFYTGWSNFGGSWSPVTCYKDANGLVTLYGLIRRTGASVSVSGICQIPAGFRPTADVMLPAATNNNPARLAVRASGDLELQNAGTGFPNVGINNSLSVNATYFAGH